MCSLLSTSLSSFLFCFHLPPASTLEFFSTSSSLLLPFCHQLWAQTGYICHPTFMTWTEVWCFVFFLLDISKLTLNPKTRPLWTEGGYLLAEVFANTHFLNQTVLMFIACHLFQHLMSRRCQSHRDTPTSWLRGAVSPSQPSYSVSPGLPRGPCVPPRPRSRHTHTHGFDNK